MDETLNIQKNVLWHLNGYGLSTQLKCRYRNKRKKKDNFKFTSFLPCQNKPLGVSPAGFVDIVSLIFEFYMLKYIETQYIN